jgi:predicted ferric reductase
VAGALSPLLLGVFYVSLALAPLILAAFSGPEPAGFWTEAASAAGMTGAVMMLLQLVSSGRFERLSGRIGIDATMSFHKWAAPLAVLFLFFHPLLFLAPIELSRLNVAMSHLTAMLTAPRNFTGVIALILTAAVVLLAVVRDRLPMPYEGWRASHGLMALGAAGATLAHILAVGTYASEWPLMVFWIALCISVLGAAIGVYTVRARSMRRQNWKLVERRRLADGLWEITLRGQPRDRLAFKAGQFAWLAVAPRRFPLFDHPFSIASAPGDESQLSFVIQEAGDFTDTVRDLPLGSGAGLDAPHGSFVLDDPQTDAIVLIAGGVGVAPIRSLLADLAAKGDTRPIRLLYGARNAAAMIDASVFEPHLKRLNAEAWFFVDETPSSGPLQQGPIGPAQVEQAIGGLDPARIAVMICGPGGMISAMADVAHDLGVPLANIRYERFDYRSGPASVKDRRMLTRFRAMALTILVGVVAFALR